MAIDEIDGVTPSEVVFAVDLEIAFSPVLRYPLTRDYNFDIPRPVAVERGRDGKKFFIASTEEGKPTWEPIAEDDLKLMRARYLLLFEYYNRSFENGTLPPVARNHVKKLYLGN